MIKNENRPLIVILGQTASGKTDLGIEIAKKYRGEIVCADSRTVYKAMDIGTAKPTEVERKTVRHHLLDLIEPDRFYSANDFKRDASKAIKDIRARGRLPIIVGGTGLYINSLVYDYEFGRTPDPKARQELQNVDIKGLQKKVKNLGLGRDRINYENKRHLIRAVENNGVIRTKKPLRENTLLLGRKIEKTELQARIRARNETMIKAGLKDEVKRLVERYGWDAPGLNSIAYKEWRKYFSGEQDIEEVKENMFKDNWQYARRQKIWFKRDVNINWLTSVEQFIRQVDQFLIQY